MTLSALALFELGPPEAYQDVIEDAADCNYNFTRPYRVYDKHVGKPMQFTTPPKPMSRVVRGGFPDREFDVLFWQEQGDEAIFSAAWDMVELAEEFKGSDVELRADFKELLRLLNQKQVKYLVVGGYAVMRYTEPFYTKDIDIWVEATAENAERTYQALVQFGAPLADLTVHDLTQDHIVFQFGMAPVRVDVMTTIDAVTFNDAWNRRVEAQLGGIPISIISLQDLIRNKESAGRDSDRLHLDRLRRYGKQ